MQVPGSLTGTNHKYSWYALVQHKKTGHRGTMWINGEHCSRESVAAHIHEFYPNVRALTIEECKSMPTRQLVPVHPNYFQTGALQAAYGIPDEPEARPLFKPIPKPISLTPLSLRRPLWQPHH